MIFGVLTKRRPVFFQAKLNARFILNPITFLKALSNHTFLSNRNVFISFNRLTFSLYFPGPVSQLFRYPPVAGAAKKL